MMKFLKANASAAVLGGSLLGALLASPAAHAQILPARATLGAPYHSGRYVKAYFHENLPSGSSHVELQRHRWYGWEKLSERRYTRGEHIATLAYNCGGQGTYTYRLTYIWWPPKKERSTLQLGKEARFSC